MTQSAFIAFCYGVAFAGSVSAVALFLRFWSSTRDPLFGWFAAAFGILGLHWAALIGANPDAEARPYYYVARLLAFGMIIIATLQKNRSRRVPGRSSAGPSG